MMLGILTVFWGVCIVFFLPDSPMRAKVSRSTPRQRGNASDFRLVFAPISECFTEEDKLKLIERVRSNQTGLQSESEPCSQSSELVRVVFDLFRSGREGLGAPFVVSWSLARVSSGLSRL